MKAMRLFIYIYNKLSEGPIRYYQLWVLSTATDKQQTPIRGFVIGLVRRIVILVIVILILKA